MEFAEAVDKHLAAIDARDLAGYLATVHDDVTLIMMNGRVLRGRDEVGEFHRDWFGDPDWSWQLSPVHSVETGDTGVAVFAVDYRDLDRDGRPYTMSYLLSLTFARDGDGWLLLHDQNTARTTE